MILLLLVLALCNEACNAQACAVPLVCTTVLTGIEATAFCSNANYVLQLATFSGVNDNASCFCGGKSFQILATSRTSFGVPIQSSFLPLLSCADGVYSFSFAPRVEGTFTLETYYADQPVAPQCTCPPLSSPGVIVTSCTTCKQPVSAYDAANNIPNGEQIVYVFP
jgi:hypothetical protein